MFIPGLVSISFRGESPETLVTASAHAGLCGIEWGSDIHVPVGDIKRAIAVGKMTRDAGLSVMAYGSYYRLGEDSEPYNNFKAVLESASALGAPTVRIWAGNTGSANTSPDKRAQMIAQAIRISEMADKYSIDIALECHNNTLTDDVNSTVDFLKSVSHTRLKMYWQPNQLRDFDYNLSAAKTLSSKALNVHVFHWDANRRYPLADGTDDWRNYLNIFQQSGQDYGLLLEFMHDNRLETLNETARTLLSWIL